MFHPDLRLLRSFAAVAEEQSVTRAAERLHLTQPTISGHIKELEQDLGFALFYRTTRSVSLTPDGARMLPLVLETLARTEALREVVGEMQADRSSRFRLGAAMYTLDIAERLSLLDDFAAALPNIRYAIDNRLQSAQIPDLAGERLDASLLLGIAAPATNHAALAKPDDSRIIVNETQYPDDLERVLLRRRTIGLLVPKTSKLAALDVIPRSALEGEKVAVLSTEHGHALIDPIENFLRDCGAITIHLNEGNALAIERYAERQGICSLGIGWFTPLPGLVQRPVEGMTMFLDFAVVLGRGANQAARRFFDFAATWQAVRERNGDVVSDAA